MKNCSVRDCLNGDSQSQSVCGLVLAAPRWVAGLAILVGTLSPQTAMASGVSAGTLIENTATATYTTGSTSGTVQSNTVTVKVDELLDVAVAGLTSTPAVAGAGNVVLAYSVTNTGNGPEAFNITVDPAVAGNDFDATVQQIVIDSNGNGTYDPGVDQVLTPGSPTPVIAADGSLKIFVIVSLPGTAADGDTSQVSLTAAAVTGTGTPGTAFAGQGEGGGDAVVGASGADDSAADALIASLAAVTLSKAAVILDPFGGDQPVPGAVVTYTLTAKVIGTGQADGLRIADAIPAGTTYETGTLKLDGGGLTDAADTDSGTAGSSGVDVNLGSVAGGTTKVVTFNVKIN
jgi:uncharacterized repeat protein (TIGR01451 family)